MKLTFVSHTVSLGGAEFSLLELVTALVAVGDQVDVIVPGRGELARRLSEVGAGIWPTRYSWWAAPTRSPGERGERARSNARGICAMLALLPRLRPDVVVTNTITIPAAAVAAKVLRVPHVWYLREFGEKDHGLRFDLGFDRSVRLIDRLSARVIVNSQALVQAFSPHVAPDKLRLVHCAVEVPDDLRPDPADSDRPFRLALLGHHLPTKGQADAIRAVGLLRGRGREIRLTLVGACSPRYLHELRDLARQVGAEARTEFVAFTNDRWPYLRRSHVALMCSRCEAFGRVTVEAMKIGIPVVGSDSGGTRELIRDGWSGLLYPPGQPAELAERIERLYDDPALREALARNARPWARATFSIARHRQEVLTVLGEVAPWSAAARRDGADVTASGDSRRRSPPLPRRSSGAP